MTGSLSSLETTLRNERQYEVLVQANGHANSDSMPLRYGLHFRADTILKLNGVEFLHRDHQHPDRFHVEACFEPPAGRLAAGHFVLAVKPGYQHPIVVTVWRHDMKTETHLSEVMMLLRRKGFLDSEQLLEMHPLYDRGEVRTHADLVHQLTLKLSGEKLAAMEAALKNAIERSDALEQEIEVLISKVEELEAEKARIEAEKAAALKERSEATLSSADTLLEVLENQMHRGSLCTILVLGDGSRRHMKTATFDPNGEVTRKARSLIGHRVRVSCWDPIGQPGKWSSQGYFRNIYLAE